MISASVNTNFHVALVLQIYEFICNKYDLHFIYKMNQPQLCEKAFVKIPNRPKKRDSPEF